MNIERLIEQCRQGDADALGELYQAYAQRMRGVCRRYVSDETAVDDVLHDAFVIIFTSLDRLRDEHRAEAWMMAIVRNVASKYKNHQNTIRTVSLEETNEAELSLAENCDTIGLSFDAAMRLVDRLPEGYGKVFRLSVFEGMTHQEIAEELGIAPHSSSSQLARAKKMLRKMIRQYWAVFLLLLIPMTLFLLRKEKSVEEIEKPVVAKQKETLQRPIPEQKQEPVIVHLPKRNTPAIPITLVVDSMMPDTLNIMITDEIPTMPDKGQPDTTQAKRQESVPRLDIADLFPDKSVISKPKNYQKWSVQLAYSGGYNSQNSGQQPYTFVPRPSATSSDPGTSPSPIIPSAIDNWSDYALYLYQHPEAVSDATRSVITRIAMNNANQPGKDKMLRSSHHQMPVTWSLDVKYQFCPRWAFETGLQYNRFTSDFEIGADDHSADGLLQGKNAIRQSQTIHYVGVPIKGVYNMYLRKSWSLYGAAGLTLEAPAYATLYSDYFVNGTKEATERTTFNAPWQLSTTIGLGLQYNLTPRLSLFAEPSLQYHFPMDTDIETYRTEHPFSFSLPIGIKITW